MGEQCSSESNTGIADSTTVNSGTSTSSSSGTGDAHDGTKYVFVGGITPCVGINAFNAPKKHSPSQATIIV